jgi:hypothetical protein
MMDAPLTHDPETGLPVRRVIGANINFMAADNTGAGSAAGGVGVVRVGRGVGVTSGFGNADCGLRNEERRFWVVGLGCCCGS